MSDALRLVDHPLIAALGWTLIHFVWQGAVLGLAAFFVLRVVRPSHASTRYLVGVATLLAMLLAPVATFLSTVNQTPTFSAAWQKAMTGQTSGAGMVTGSIIADVAANPAAARRLLPTDSGSPRSLDPAPIAPIWLPIVTAFWMAGVAVLSLRMLGGWILTQSLARRAVAAVSPNVDAAAHRIARRLDLRRRVSVFESGAVSVPTLVGWVRPVVLLPAAALAGLTSQQLEAVIAHELAHVRRHDYLINLLQSVVETVLFYHPAVWWVSSDVRAEREHCCDDLAVAVCGDRLVYVSALAELTSMERRAFALAATDGSLVARVRRILGRPSDGRRELPPSWGVLALLVMIGGGAGTYEMTSAAADIEQFAQAAAETQSPNAARAEAQNRQAQDRFSFESIAPVASATTQAVAGKQAPPVPFDPVGDLMPPPPAPPAPPAPPTPPVGFAPAVPVWPGFAPAPPAPPTARALPLWLAVPAAPPVHLAPPAPAAPFAPAPAAPPAPVPPSTPFLAPAAPAPPAPPDAPAGSGQSVSRSEGSFSWNHNGDRLAVKWTGPFRLSDDERDIAWVEEGAKVTVADGWVFTDRIELRGLANGTVERKFFRSGFERDYEAEGRSFLANAVQRMIRSGMFASERVARFLKQGGPDAVLAEIDRLQTDSSYLKRVYYSALLKQADLAQPQLARVLDRIGKDISSDYEKATLLVQVLQEPSVTDQQRLEVTRATRGIGSDHEQRKVLTAVLAADPLASAVAMAAIEATASIGSSHDRSSVLLDLANKGAVTAQTSASFMGAVSSMPSSHDQRRVLAALAGSAALPEGVALDSLKAASAMSSSHDQRQVVSAYLAQTSASPKVAAAALAAATTISSSHDKTEVLIQVVAKGGVSDETAPAFFAAVSTIGSSHDLRRALTALLARGKLSDNVLAGLLRTSASISSSHDRSQLLLQVLKTQTLSPAGRAVFLEAAESISSSTAQNEVLAALVRSERR